jgi:hypothetical protein
LHDFLVQVAGVAKVYVFHTGFLFEISDPQSLAEAVFLSKKPLPVYDQAESFLKGKATHISLAHLFFKSAGHPP